MGVIVSVGRRRAGVRLCTAATVSSIVGLGVRVGGFAVEVGRGVAINNVGDAVGRAVAVTNWNGVWLGNGVIVSMNEEHPVNPIVRIASNQIR